MQVVIGANRPAWLNMVIRPQVVDRKLKLELLSANFPIERDNWYVTEPNGVDVFPLPMLRGRISEQLTQGVYAKQAEFEQQIVSGVPQMLAQIEAQAAARMDRVMTFGRWPMPVWQPRAKMWLSKLHIDEAGISASIGVTLGAIAPQSESVPIRRFPAPQTSSPVVDRGLQIAISRDVIQAWTTLLSTSEVRKFHTLDFHSEKFRQLGNPEFLAQVLPGCFDPHAGEIQSVLSFEQPIQFDETPAAAGEPLPSRRDQVSSSTLRMVGKELRLTISQRPDRGTKWQAVAEFPISWQQDFRMTAQKTGHRGRALVAFGRQPGCSVLAQVWR